MVVGMVTRPTQLSTDIPANGPAGLARDRDLAQNSAGNTAESYRADPIGRALAGIAAAGGSHARSARMAPWPARLSTAPFAG